MADALTIQTLKQKRAEISGVIAAYQAKIAQARHDLAHINAVIRLVEGGEQERAQYIVLIIYPNCLQWRHMAYAKEGIVAVEGFTKF
jgi:hypothetical protein